jgi:hypothetical protein
MIKNSKISLVSVFVMLVAVWHDVTGLSRYRELFNTKSSDRWPQCFDCILLKTNPTNLIFFENVLKLNLDKLL